MGNRKLKWTAEEEEALMAGIAKHGAGKWKTILVDAEFAHILSNRSNVDLKDKWRNIGSNHGQGSNVMTSKKGKATAPSDHNVLQKKISPHAFASKENSSGMPPLSPLEVNDAPKHNTMILEAISTIKDGRGSDFGAILGFIERKYEVPQGFRRSLISKLRRLVSQGTLEKAKKRYKIKIAASGPRTITPRQKPVCLKPLQNLCRPANLPHLDAAANNAACTIAEAENKAFVAAEAVREAERVSQMADDADVMLMCLEEIVGQCSCELIFMV